MNYPKEYRYTKDHEWAHIQGSTVTIGITDHAQSQLGDIVFVDLPAVGRTLKQGEPFGVVESIKAVSDLYAPVTGKVTAANEALKTEPATLNQSPHEKGWLIKIELTDPMSAEKLLDAAAYEKLL